MKKQLLSRLYNSKVIKTRSLQKQQKSRLIFPLNNDFKKLAKLEEIKIIMANKKVPFYKRFKKTRKIRNIKKFSLDFFNRSFFELTPNMFNQTNNRFLKKKTLGIFNKFAKLYKRKLFKNFGKFNGLTRREFRLNIKNLFSHFLLSNLLIKKSFYNFTMTDFNTNKDNLDIDSVKPKKILAKILQLFGTMIKNNYTRKNSFLFYQLSRTGFRSPNVIKNLRRRYKSAFYTVRKIERKNQNKFRLKKRVIQKFSKLKKKNKKFVTKGNRFVKSKNKFIVKKKHFGVRKSRINIFSKKALKKNIRKIHIKTIKSLVFLMSNTKN